MSADICPFCAEPASFLEDLSRTANVDYFRCDSCSHIWSIEKSRAVSPEQPRSQPTPHPCPSCKSGLCHSHRVAIIASRPDIVFVGLTCDACGHQWTIEKPIDVSKSDKAS
jgi:transcription elongation factor Elf1